MIQFNKAALQKQRRQTINNAYNNISYIIKECKPYLFGMLEGVYPLLRTDTNYRFQTILNEKGVITEPFSTTLSPDGRYVLFPADEFDILDECVILDGLAELHDSLSRKELVGKILDYCLTQHQEIMMWTKKVYCLDYKHYQTVEHVITYTLKRMILN